MRKIRLSQILPEGIPGPGAWFYSNVPGRIFRSAQETLGIYRRLELVRRESA